MRLEEQKGRVLGALSGLTQASGFFLGQVESLGFMRISVLHLLPSLSLLGLLSLSLPGSGSRNRQRQAGGSATAV